VLHGSLEGLTDEDGTVPLVLAAGALDFQAAIDGQERIAGQPYLLFLKERPRRQARPPTGWEGSLWRRPLERRVFQWALYRPDKPLLLRVRTMYSWHRNR
jgi:hypothetical protein